MIFNRSFKLSHARAAEALANQPSNSGSVRGPLISKLEVNFLSGTHPPDRDRQASFVQNGAACVVGQMFIMRARRSYWSKAARHGMDGMALQMQIDHSWTPARMHEALSLGKGRNARALFHDVFITVAPHSIRSRSARRARPPCWVGCCAVPKGRSVNACSLSSFIHSRLMTAFVMMIQLYNVI